MTTLDVVVVALGIITLACAALAVLTPRVVHAALWLVAALLGVASVQMVMGAEIVALTQVLVQVGAVVVLVVVALGVTDAPLAATGAGRLDASRGQRLAAAAAGAGLAGLVGAVLVPTVGGALVDVRGSRSVAVAEALFGTWVWPLELLSLLLLAALVGALAVLTRSGDTR